MRERPYWPQLELAKEYGPIFVVRRQFFSRTVVLTDADALKRVLITNAKNYEKFQIAAGTERLIGKGLVLQEGAAHAHAKRGINPAFSFQNLKTFVPMFAEESMVLVNKWKQTLPAQGQEINLHALFCKLTLDIIGLTAFGYHFNSVERDDDTLTNAYNRLLTSGSPSFKNLIPFYHLLSTQENREVEAARLLVRNKVGEIIEARKQSFLASVDSAPASLLDALLLTRDDEGKPWFSSEELFNQVMTFLVAGHETTSVALSWFIYHLAQQPHVEAKLREELSTVLGAEHDRPITWDSLHELPYLEACLKESMRLHPPAPITIREALDDDVLCGYPIPKGTIVSISPGVLGRLPSLWEDPDAFKPERFLEKRPGGSGGETLSEDTKADTTGNTGAANTTTGTVRRSTRTQSAADSNKPDGPSRHPYAWLPFLAGNRACIGQRFAMLEAMAVLAILLPRFKFAMSPEQVAQVRPKLMITLRPYPALPVTVSPLVAA